VVIEARRPSASTSRTSGPTVKEHLIQDQTGRASAHPKEHPGPRAEGGAPVIREERWRPRSAALCRVLDYAEPESSRSRIPCRYGESLERVPLLLGIIRGRSGRPVRGHRVGSVLPVDFEVPCAPPDVGEGPVPPSETIDSCLLLPRPRGRREQTPGLCRALKQRSVATPRASASRSA